MKEKIMKTDWMYRQKESAAVLFFAVLIWSSIQNGNAWMSAAWAGIAGIAIGIRIGSARPAEYKGEG
jgi:hypothetical protein